MSTNGRNRWLVEASDFFRQQAAERTADYPMLPLVLEGIRWSLAANPWREARPVFPGPANTKWVVESPREMTPVVWVFFTIWQKTVTLEDFAIVDEWEPDSP